MLNSSDFLKKKYGQPIYGSEIASLNFKDHTWITYDEQGCVRNPYLLLAPIFKDIDPEMLDELMTSERKIIISSLLRYCEFDTLAMVMIWEGWKADL